PLPAGKWLTELAGDSWMLVLDEAYKHLNQRYRSELLASWRNSVGQRYPFSRDSESEVTLSDFREFFRSRGTAEQFFVQYLQPFVSSSALVYQIRLADGRGLLITLVLLEQTGLSER